jgi:hypothetical protein
VRRKKMKAYEFTVRVIGVGNTPQEAWEGILEDGTFRFDDGDYEIPEEKDIELIEDYGEEE